MLVSKRLTSSRATGELPEFTQVPLVMQYVDKEWLPTSLANRKFLLKFKTGVHGLCSSQIIIPEKQSYHVRLELTWVPLVMYSCSAASESGWIQAVYLVVLDNSSAAGFS